MGATVLIGYGVIGLIVAYVQYRRYITAYRKDDERLTALAREYGSAASYMDDPDEMEMFYTLAGAFWPITIIVWCAKWWCSR